jgi:hypothetical protein
MTKNYVVIENTPGYLPDNDDPPTFDSYAEAVNHTARYYKELQEQGFKVTPIVNGSFTYYGKGDITFDLGRVVEIMPLEDE